MDKVFGTDPHFLVRRNDPDTSHEAAHGVDSTSLENLVYEVIKSHGIIGCISDQVRATYPNFPYSSITARYKGLLTKGWIVDSGVRRPGKSGRNQRVLIAACLLQKEQNNAVR